MSVAEVLQVYVVPLADLPVAPAGEQKAPGLTVAAEADCVGVGVAETVGCGVATGVGLGVVELEAVGLGDTSEGWLVCS